MSQPTQTRGPIVALAGLLLVAVAGGPSSCFLPPWDERPWVGDDDTVADDDATGDDDTTAPDEIQFEGTLDVNVTYPGVVNSDCQTPLSAEYDVPDGTLDGEAACALPPLAVDFELDAEIAGSSVTGQLEITDSDGQLPFGLEAAVTGTYDEDQGHIEGVANLNWYGVLVQGTFALDEI